MRIVAFLMAGMMLASVQAAAPQIPTDKRLPEQQSTGQKPAAQAYRDAWEIEARALQLYPKRRDAPLRELNMSDNEVREVQVIANRYKMPELVNISPVVTGCPCEEGGSCTEQVYITSRVGQGWVGMQLSRKKNLWTVGVVQKWWLEYAALKARESGMNRVDYQKARENLLLALPICADPAKAKAT